MQTEEKTKKEKKDEKKRRKSSEAQNIESFKKIPKKHKININKLYHFKYTWASDGMPLFFDKNKLEFTKHDKEVLKDIILDTFPDKHREKVSLNKIYFYLF